MKIPFINLKSQFQSIKREINSALNRVFQNSSFILGQEVELFEKEFAKYCGAKYCLGVNSGTSAVHLALLSLGIGPKDEVITQPNTFFATAEAISYTGAKPVFVDIDPETFTIDADKIEKAITPRARVILPVHLYGNAAPIEKILKIARKHNLTVIEDVCQAHGVFYRNKRLGTFGRVGCFSFYPGKVLGAYGEGGAVITDDKKAYEKMKSLRDHGQLNKNEHLLIGYNYRMEGIQGAILKIKLKELDKWISKRKKQAKLYNLLLKRTGVVVPSKISLNSSNFQYYVIRCKKRDHLKDYLQKNGVSTLIHYPTPIHLQKAYKFLGYQKGDFPIAEGTCKEILSLPMYPEITKRQISYIVNLIKKFYGNQK